jgi:hypothetical protein
MLFLIVFRQTTCVAVMAGLLLQGCATHPDDVSASHTSTMRYQGYTCPQLAAEMDRVMRQVDALTGRQRKQATKDAWTLGVGLVLFWPALFFMIGEDKKEERATLKGEYEALEQAAIQSNCESARPNIEQAKAKAAEAVSSGMAQESPRIPSRRTKPISNAFPE